MEQDERWRTAQRILLAFHISNCRCRRLAAGTLGPRTGSI